MELQRAIYLKKIFHNIIKNITINKSGHLFITVDEMHLYKFLYFQKMHTNSQFKQLLDIFGSDYPNRRKRFELNYMAVSLFFNLREFYKVHVYEDQALDSVMTLYKSACWLEREIWDMYGIFFKSHGDLRRILTDYGFEGFPLRKDFPLTGYLQFRYDDEVQTVIGEDTELTQEYRNFGYYMPWTVEM